MPEMLVPLLGPLALKITLDATDAERRLGEYGERLRDPRPFFLKAGRIIRGEYAENFRQGGRPPWRPLADRTVAERQDLINLGVMPPRTATGGLPRRLAQRLKHREGYGFDAHTILIRLGTLRDSWAVKGARGNVEEIEGDGAFYGSQLTIPREIKPHQERGYQIISRRQRLRLRRTGRGAALIPLALIHEAGTRDGRIPARPNAVLGPEAVEKIAGAGLAWAAGEAGDNS
jgi:phage gpG-like protein